MLTVTMAWRNVWRNPRRTALTLVAIALAVGLLSWGYAFFQGALGVMYASAVEEGGQVRIVTQGYAARERLFPLEETVNASDARLQALAGIPGVAWVGRRILFGGLLDVHDQNTPALGLALDDRDAREGYNLGRKLTAGRLPAAAGEAVIGSAIAERLRARIGDELTLVTRSTEDSTAAANLKVVGIANLGASILGRRFFVRFPDAQRYLRMPDQASILVVTGGPIGDEPALIARLQQAGALRPNEVVQAWSDHGLMAGALGILNAVNAIITCIIMAVAAMGVINPMFVAIMERTREFGVMMALGVTGRRILGSVVLEAVMMGLVGSSIGVVIGIVGVSFMAYHGISLGSAVGKIAIPLPHVLYPALRWSDTLRAFTVGVVVAAIGAIWPAWRAARLDPVVAMRSR